MGEVVQHNKRSEGKKDPRALGKRSVWTPDRCRVDDGREVVDHEVPKPKGPEPVDVVEPVKRAAAHEKNNGVADRNGPHNQGCQICQILPLLVVIKDGNVPYVLDDKVPCVVVSSNSRWGRVRRADSQLVK